MEKRMWDDGELELPVRQDPAWALPIARNDAHAVRLLFHEGRFLFTDKV